MWTSQSHCFRVFPSTLYVSIHNEQWCVWTDCDWYVFGILLRSKSQPQTLISIAVVRPNMFNIPYTCQTRREDHCVNLSNTSGGPLEKNPKHVGRTIGQICQTCLEDRFINLSKTSGGPLENCAKHVGRTLGEMCQTRGEDHCLNPKP